MGKINWGRVVLGGLLAGVVLNVFDFIVWGLWLAPDFAAAMEALGKQDPAGAAIALFVVWEFVFGIFLVWLYAAIRPRFGAGPRTAVLTGLAVWFLWGLMHAIGEAPMGLFPTKIYVIGVIVGLVQLTTAALAGGALYQEAGPGSSAAA